ncbi:hypothetical protein ACSBR2_012615 [Camellia fascicularis]
MEKLVKDQSLISSMILHKVRFAFSFTIEEEDQQRAKTQFSIDTHPPFELALASIFFSWIPNFCVCALIQYFSPFSVCVLSSNHIIAVPLFNQHDHQVHMRWLEAVFD